jgi:hypothetical protein
MAPTPDITLYSMATPNGIKASIILEELGLQYKLVPIDISTNVQKEPYVFPRLTYSLPCSDIRGERGGGKTRF